MWGFRVEGDAEVVCGSPGPVLRGRVGDLARITLTNLEGNTMPHNIDFHAVTGQGGGAADLTVAPGETATIEARLLYSGAFMYHCAFGDVPLHMAKGMCRGTSPKAQWYMKAPEYSRRASIVAVSPGATVRSAAPPPWPVTAWKSMLCGMVLPSRLVRVIRARSPTRPRRTGPGEPQTTSASPSTRKPHISVTVSYTH